jgi:hypothetical protein
MLAALVILLTAILVSAVWHDPPVQGYEESRPARKHAPEG